MSDQGTGNRSNPASQILSVAVQTVRQTRGPVLWLVTGLGSVLALAGGAALTGAQGGGDLTALIFHTVLVLLLVVGGLAAGARALAQDRVSGLRDLLGARPMFGPSFFLGRFGGLALRFSLATLLLAVIGGAIMLAADGRNTFLRAAEAREMDVGGTRIDRGDIVRLQPGGPGARWSFEGSGESSGEEASLRFSFRVRHPRRKPLQNNLPLHVTVRSGEKVLVDRELTVSLRREFTMPFPQAAGKNIDVECAVTGGHNLMETGPPGCRLVHGESGPITALVMAAGAFLPLLWLVLALSLVFSAFVRETTAFLAAGVILLVALAGPALEKDCNLIAAGVAGCGHSHTHDGDHECAGEGGEPAAPVVRFLARSAGAALSLLPDPGAGSAAVPLSRGECPSMGDAASGWAELLPYLALLLVLGCAVFSWRRP